MIFSFLFTKKDDKADPIIEEIEVQPEEPQPTKQELYDKSVLQVYKNNIKNELMVFFEEKCFTEEDKVQKAAYEYANGNIKNKDHYKEILEKFPSANIEVTTYSTMSDSYFIQPPYLSVYNVLDYLTDKIVEGEQ